MTQNGMLDFKPTKKIGKCYKVDSIRNDVKKMQK